MVTALVFQSFTQPQLCRKFEFDLTVKNKFSVCFAHQSEARTAVSCMGFSMVMTAAGRPVLPPSA